MSEYGKAALITVTSQSNVRYSYPHINNHHLTSCWKQMSRCFEPHDLQGNRHPEEYTSKMLYINCQLQQDDMTWFVLSLAGCLRQQFQPHAEWGPGGQLERRCNPQEISAERVSCILAMECCEVIAPWGDLSESSCVSDSWDHPVSN